MGRIAKPWFRKHDGWWYGTLTPGMPPEKLAQGQRNRKTAEERFHALKARRRGIAECDHDRYAVIIEKYLEHTFHSRKPKTYRNYRDLLSSFAQHAGHVNVAKLTARHATLFLEKQATKKPAQVTTKLFDRRGNPIMTKAGNQRTHTVTVSPWGQNRQATFIAVLRACFNWAVKEGLISSHPFHGISRPFVESRTPIMPDDDLDLIMSATDDNFRQVIYALRQTGCRPSELTSVTAADVDTTHWRWILREHKTEAHLSTKVIWLTDGMIELTKTLMERYPDGPLFRNLKGTPWTKDTIGKKFRRLRKKLGLSHTAVPYAIRHTFITEALAKSVPIATVAELVGHKSTRMITKHYSHLDQKVDHLRQSLARATSRESV